VINKDVVFDENSMIKDLKYEEKSQAKENRNNNNKSAVHVELDELNSDEMRNLTIMIKKRHIAQY
jgi:hypothetical protein